MPPSLILYFERVLARVKKVTALWFPGVVAVLLCCVVILYAAFRTSDRYYQRQLVAADTSYYLAGATLVLSGKDELTTRQVLANPAPLRSSDSGTSVYVLQTLVAWCLRAILPLRPAMAVILNGVWFVAMALSVYALCWSRIGRWSTAAVATIAFLFANPFMPTVLYGVTSMDPNLVGFMLATSALCWTVLSERFTRMIPSLLVGLFLGALCLGRVYTLGLLAPAMLPYVVSCFWRRTRQEMWVSLQHGIFALSVAFGVCGWFLVRHWRVVLKYPTQFGSAGVLHHSDLRASLWQWLSFPKWVFSQNVILVCVLSWPLAASLFGSARSLRSFNWSALWAALVPLLVLAKMGTTFEPYGTLVLFGLFVVLLFPFDRPDPALLYRGRFAAALWLACSFNCWTFFSELRTTHHSQYDDKSPTVEALKLLRDDALESGRRRVTLGLVHWGTLHDAALVNSLVVDVGVRVTTPDSRTKRRSNDAMTVELLATDPWAWDPEVVGPKALTAEAWADRVIKDADYVIVLSGARSQDRRQGRWPPWVEASDRIRSSLLFHRLGSPFRVPSDGGLELLARTNPGSD